MSIFSAIFGKRKPKVDVASEELRCALERHKRASDNLYDLIDQTLRQNDLLRKVDQPKPTLVPKEPLQ